VLTAIGVAGFLLYRSELSQRAHLLLVVYSVTGLSSLAHFIYGVPATPVQVVSVALDGVTGAAMLAFAIWSYATPARIRMSA
jgi:hypothetical protein